MRVEKKSSISGDFFVRCGWGVRFFESLPPRRGVILKKIEHSWGKNYNFCALFYNFVGWKGFDYKIIQKNIKLWEEHLSIARRER